MPFIHDDFLLQTGAARRLFHEFARDEPILDYHNHLPPRDIALNRQFNDLGELWLEGDHYKWRAMRADGVEERFCTGDAAPYEKFLAWAKVAPHTLRNPLFHWTHLELKRYFDIDELLNEDSAPAIWDAANARLQTPEFRAQGLLKKFGVRALCTTDDPALPLEWHQKIAADGATTDGSATRVYPTFRPDKALAVGTVDFNVWTEQLAEVAGIQIGSFDDFFGALDKRHADFHAVGCRLSDHGLGQAFAEFSSQIEAARIFESARCGETVPPSDAARFAGYMMVFFGLLDAKRGWTKQLHIGALRSNNSRALQRLGPDTGFDSIGDLPQAAALGAFLDKLESEDALPQMVLYNLNPADNYLFATMAGNFQSGRAGKIQFGSGRWFLDQKEAMEWQLNALSNNGLLSRFIGMLTDSRSFASFPRHEYFRRVLCNLIGRDMEAGEIPADFALVGGMVKNICYANARDFLGLETE